MTHGRDEQSQADTTLYAQMVVEDRRLRLAGEEVCRFSGHELMQPGAPDPVSTFFGNLQQRMT